MRQNKFIKVGKRIIVTVCVVGTMFVATRIGSFIDNKIKLSDKVVQTVVTEELDYTLAMTDDDVGDASKEEASEKMESTSEEDAADEEETEEVSTQEDDSEEEKVKTTDTSTSTTNTKTTSTTTTKTPTTTTSNKSSSGTSSSSSESSSSNSSSSSSSNKSSSSSSSSNSSSSNSSSSSSSSGSSSSSSSSSSGSSSSSTTTTTSSSSTSTTTTSGSLNSTLATEFQNAINTYRASLGLSSLTYDSSLQSYANTRATELATLFSHTRPNGTSVTASYGVKAEIIGQSSSARTSLVMSGWKNSSGHNAVMTSTTYTKFAAASYTANGKTYTTVIFK